MGRVNPPACTVIVPVFNSFADTVRCLRSVLASTAEPFRLLVLDDCSSEGMLAESLPEDLRGIAHMQVVRNEANLGFVKTCNRGIRLAGADDIVLLNSDTEVTDGWLGKLRAAAYSGPRVATATPLTNNGQLCSVPLFMENNPLPRGYTLAEFAALIDRVSVRQYPSLPTCNGFCVYIRRAVLDEVGLLDEELFGRGYGEENDFSCRAQNAGYIDVLDDATFVFHRGGVTFRRQQQELRTAHLKALGRKHPRYLWQVRSFIEQNRLAPIHRRVQVALLERWNDGACRRILHVLHDGIERSDVQAELRATQVLELAAALPDLAHWWLRPVPGGYELRALAPGFQQVYRFSRQIELEVLIHRRVFDLVHLHAVSKTPDGPLAAALTRHGRCLLGGNVTEDGEIVPATLAEDVARAAESGESRASTAAPPAVALLAKTTPQQRSAILRQFLLPPGTAAAAANSPAAAAIPTSDAPAVSTKGRLRRFDRAGRAPAAGGLTSAWLAASPAQWSRHYQAASPDRDPAPTRLVLQLLQQWVQSCPTTPHWRQGFHRLLRLAWARIGETIRFWSWVTEARMNTLWQWVRESR